MRLIIQIGVVVNNALKPEISRLAGCGELEQARKFTWRATTLIISLCSVIYLCGVIVGPWIIHWWGHGKVNIDRIDLALIGIHALVNIAWFVPAALLIALNNHVSAAAIYGSSSVFGLVLWLITKNLFTGIIGASSLLALPEIVVLLVILNRNFSLKNIKIFNSN